MTPYRRPSEVLARHAFLDDPTLLTIAEPPTPAGITNLNGFHHSMHRPKGAHMDSPKTDQGLRPKGGPRRRLTLKAPRSAVFSAP